MLASICHYLLYTAYFKSLYAMLKCVRLQGLAYLILLRSTALDVAKDQAHVALIWVATLGLVMADNVDTTTRIVSQAIIKAIPVTGREGP
jgi:hypothetical protein